MESGFHFQVLVFTGQVVSILIVAPVVSVVVFAVKKPPEAVMVKVSNPDVLRETVAHLKTVADEYQQTLKLEVAMPISKPTEPWDMTVNVLEVSVHEIAAVILKDTFP